MYYSDFSYLFDLLGWSVALGGLLQLALYVAESLGLYAMARNTGVHNPWVAWLPIARDYLLQNGYAPAFADRVASLVVQHQARERMQDPDTPIELVILMEADMLDERGALGILWDAMAEGAKPLQTYEGTLERLKMRKLYRRPERNPLVTERGRAFWAEKQRLHMDFVLALERDLGLTDD